MHSEHEECGLESPGFLLQIEQLISSEGVSESRVTPDDSSSSTLPTPTDPKNEFESYSDFCIEPKVTSPSFFAGPGIFAPTLADSTSHLPRKSSSASLSLSSPSPPLFTPTTSPLGSPANKCSICRENQRDAVLIPCGHKFGCFACSDKFSRCPHCLEDVKQVLRILPCEGTPQYQNADRNNAEASTLIKEHGKTGDIDSCWAVWARLTGDTGGFRNRYGLYGAGSVSIPYSPHSTTPNEITLGCMVDALVSNRQVLAAENLVRQWKSRVPPNTVVYSTLIHGWAKQNDAKRALGIFSLMRREGVPCNAVTYNCVIHACVRVGDMEGALSLLETMKGPIQQAIGEPTLLRPDKFTYSTIIKGYCGKGEIEQALALFDGMLKEGLSPDLVIYNTLLDGCVKRRHHEVCDRLLQEMTSFWGIHPNSYTLSILIKRFGRQGDLIKAFELVDALPKKYGFQANAHVWTCLISACLTQGRLPVAEAVFAAMCGMNREISNPEDRRLIMAVEESLGGICAPDAKTYETLILGCVRFQLPGRALSLALQCLQRFGGGRLAPSCVEQVAAVAANAGLDVTPLLIQARGC